MIKTRYDINYTDSVISSYKILQRNGVLKITDFWKAVCLVFGLKEFELLNLRSTSAIEFESYVINLFIKWIKGEPVDFKELEESIYSFGDFVEMEKLLFESGNLQERLWAIFIYLVDHELNL